MCKKKFPSKNFKGIIYFIVCFFLSSPAIAATELIEEVSIFEDQSRSLDLQTAKQQRFTPTNQDISLGYRNSAFWLRLQILPAPDGGAVLLSVRSQILDDVEFFIPALKNSTLQLEKIENKEYAAYKKSLQVSPNMFQINPPEGGEYYFLRLSSNGSISAVLSAQPLGQSIRSLIIRNSQHLSYLFLLFSMLAWSFFKLLKSKNSLFGWFIPMQIAWIFHNLISIGYLQLLLPNVDNSTFTEIFRYLVVILCILVDIFHRAILIRFNPAHNLIRMLDLHILFATGIAIFYVFTGSNMALILNAFNIAFSPLIFLIIVSSAKKESPPGLLALKRIYSALLILSTLWVLQLFGAELYGITNIDGPVIYGLFVSALLFFIQTKYSRGMSLAAEKAMEELARLKENKHLAQKTNETLFQFLNMLSHETKNALSVINMTISTSQISDTHRERIANSSANLNRVIERCNQALHLEEIDKRINTQICNLKQILDRHCNNNAMKGRIIFSAPKDLSIRADPVLLDVIFGNLLENALKYSPPGSPVNINVSTDGHVIVVLYENFEGDSGAPDPERVFERHYRHQNVHGQPGSGLGLYIVREMVNAHNGQIHYHRTEVGIQFRITLPC